MMISASSFRSFYFQIWVDHPTDVRRFVNENLEQNSGKIADELREFGEVIIKIRQS